MIIDIGCGNTSHVTVGIGMLEGDCYDDIEEIYPDMDVKNPIMASAEHIPIRDKIFRLSVSFEVLEHVESPALMIKEMARVSNKIKISTPNAYYIAKVIRAFFKGIYSVYKGPIQDWGMIELKNLFYYCGVDDVEISYLNPLQHKWHDYTPLKYRLINIFTPRDIKYRSLLVTGIPNNKTEVK